MSLSIASRRLGPFLGGVVLAPVITAGACARATDASEPSPPEAEKPEAEPEAKAPSAKPETDPAPAATEGASPVPEAFERGPAPHLVVADAAAAIEYYERVFGAEEAYRALGPGGTVVHAMLRIGDAVLTLSEEQPQVERFAPTRYEGSPFGLHLYVDDAVATYSKALEAGAREVEPVTYQFWGDRHGRLLGPFGHSWSVATRVSEIPADDQRALAERAAAGEAIEEPADAEPMAPPPGWSALTPSLVVSDVDAAVQFYGEAFGAETRSTLSAPGGETIQAEIQIRDQIVLVSAGGPDADEGPVSPLEAGGTSVQLTYYVEDAGATQARALAAGADETLPITEMFWGDLWSEVEDPFGHVWSIATRTEVVPPEEIERRARELSGDAGARSP